MSLPKSYTECIRELYRAHARERWQSFLAAHPEIYFVGIC